MIYFDPGMDKLPEKQLMSFKLPTTSNISLDFWDNSQMVARSSYIQSLEESLNMNILFC